MTDMTDNQDTESREIKRKIIQAASILYEKKGLYETSVAEIAEEAGISVPVTYQYVKRKADILKLIMENFTIKFTQRVRPEIDAVDEPSDKLRRAVHVFMSLVDEDLAKVVLVYRKSRQLEPDGRKRIMEAETEHVKVFEEIITLGVEKGVFKADDVNMAAYNILMAGHAWALKKWHFGRKMKLEDYIGLQTDFMLKALGA